MRRPRGHRDQDRRVDGRRPQVQRRHQGPVVRQLLHEGRTSRAAMTDRYALFMYVPGEAAGGPHDLVLVGRSEEHTSELQSLMRISYAVFCLKKKKLIQLKKHALNTKQITSSY